MDVRFKVGWGEAMTCVLRGVWNSEQCDIYPEIYLHQMPCEMRLAAGTDPAPQQLIATFDDVSRTETSLQQETGAVIGSVLDPGVDPGVSISGNVSIHVLTERGRNAVTEWRLQCDSPDLGRHSSIYFQARPFTVARLLPPQFDPEAGTDFAYWRSDDPEGPQWRVPDATVDFELPPQGVAEEMERGNRFWPKDERDINTKRPYIDTERPLKYRFTPPTRISVRPAPGIRRYNKSPNNLARILRDARVESFTTEVLYPVRMQFRVDRDGLPEVRISEAASFFGDPGPNLPPVTNDSHQTKTLVRDVLPLDLADWLLRNDAGVLEQSEDRKPTDIDNFITEYGRLRGAQSAARAIFAARLAQYHLYDPSRRDRGLHLQRGLKFEMRQARQNRSPNSPGTPPLINPLPVGTELTDSQQQDILRFLKSSPGSPPDWGHPDDGSNRAGAVHTIEFASELVSVLRNPESEIGLLEKLAFSALGASGTVSISFDEGRTTFVGDVSEGQLMRLTKIRIGRIGVVWNRAKHVIVYERTVAPSEQFNDEQKDNPMYGWPVLRKSEEYVEPTELIRTFANEAHAKECVPGFLEGSEFATARIYVNGAWGRDLGNGYEIPLWNRHDTSGFYPKPMIALRTFAGEGHVSRAWHVNPDELYFYTNTEPGTGNDPDAWAPQPGVDLSDAGPMRIGVLTKLDGSPLGKHTVPAPRLGGSRRHRFDLEVRSDGPANLQQGRGQTAMLAPLNVVTLARTSARSAIGEDDHTPDEVTTEKERIQGLVNYGARVDQVRAEVAAFIEKLPSLILKNANSGCTNLKLELETKTTDMFKRLEQELGDLGKDAPLKSWISLSDQIRIEITHLVVYPSKLLRLAVERLQTQVKRAISDANLKGSFHTWQQQLKSAWTNDVLECLNHARSQITNTKKALGAQKGQLKNLKQAAKSLAGELKNFEKANKKQLQIIHRTAQKLRNNIAIISVPWLGTPLACLENIAQLVETITSDLVTLTDQQLSDVRGAIKEGFENFNQLAKAILIISSDIVTTADYLTKTLELKLTAEDDIAKWLNNKWTTNNAATYLNELSSLLDLDVTARGASLLAGFAQWESEVSEKVGQLSIEMDNNLKIVSTSLVSLFSAVRNAFNVNDAGLKWLQNLKNRVFGQINNLDCANLDLFREDLDSELQQLEEAIEKNVGSAILPIIDKLASVPDKSLRKYSDVAGKGLKLIKAIGGMPALPHLRFNAERAEYVYDDVKKQIETSAFAAYLRDLDGGLKEVGLAIPTHELLDQLIPAKFSADFREIFTNLGGMDFGTLFAAFRLPEILPDQVKITHGLDRATRSAWIKAEVNADFGQEETLFDLDSLSVRISGMSLRATSDIHIQSDGSRHAVTDGRFTGDWALVFSGARLVSFRQVTVRFDGRRFSFDISPGKVELHPALRFISDIAKRIGKSLPPAVEVVRDTRGLPCGARASLTTSIDNPKPLGPITLGSLVIAAGLGLSVDQQGKFVVTAHASVGSKQAPIFVQIGYLGGGCWLETSVRRADESRTSEANNVAANIGLAVGSTRALNIAGVAQGSYSILVFVYASFEDDQGNFSAGLSIRGGARILGFVNAYVGLLLEVDYRSDGSASGHGVLDVEVEICWCYTLHVHRQVDHKLG